MLLGFYQVFKALATSEEFLEGPRKSQEGLGSPSTTFLGNPRAKRATVLPARVFDIAAPTGRCFGGRSPREGAANSQEGTALNYFITDFRVRIELRSSLWF